MNSRRLLASVLTCVCCVAFRPAWTLPNVVAARSACATELLFELFRAGTANKPIGPSALGLSCSPRSPPVIAFILDWKSPALPWRPSMAELLMPNPDVPVGPPTGGGGGPGVGLGDGLGPGDGLGLPPPGFFGAMSGAPDD
ncbi:hypothetical protein FHS29_001604 [Saccharothrix tamanrassetensis]|uniref:Secreted protein n=1 Tax=Saccharothrix tamanrassetensis TaxID=1051531 RepID=A0A841CF92_9PSEU|nr:hypothetical protein [Saccharothrix tamanrassetensis]MBB5955034.1 hypothetical protein [Saccharothrix tamanrassetensis]